MKKNVLATGLACASFMTGCGAASQKYDTDPQPGALVPKTLSDNGVHLRNALHRDILLYDDAFSGHPLGIAIAAEHLTARCFQEKKAGTGVVFVESADHQQGYADITLDEQSNAPDLYDVTAAQLERQLPHC